MDTLEIPIFGKAYELMKVMYSYRSTIPKQDRYALWQRCEVLLVEILENILLAAQVAKAEKLPPLAQASLKLNVLRVFLRLAKDTKVIDSKKYVRLEVMVNEIGRMLGGWLKASGESGR